jgi:hypothetical protein
MNELPARFKDRDKKLRLKELEGVIRNNISAVYEVAAALKEISEAKLYRLEFKSFDEYCKGRWQFGKDKAYRLIGTTKTKDTAGSKSSQNATTTDNAGSKSEGFKSEESGSENKDANSTRSSSGESDAGESSQEPKREEDSSKPELPDPLQPYFADNPDFDKASKTAKELTVLLERLEEAPATKKVLKNSTNRLYSKNTKGIPDRIAEVKPIRMCRKCDGAVKPSDAQYCDVCSNKGYVVADEVKGEADWVAGAKQ